MAMHRLLSLAFASVFSAQVGAIPFLSSEMLLELKITGQQILAASVQPRDFSPPGWEAFLCFE